MFKLTVTNETFDGEPGYHVEAQASGFNVDLCDEMAHGIVNLIEHMSGDTETYLLLFLEKFLSLTDIA